MAAPLLATVFAAPASAAPEDVTLTAEVQGNDVAFTLTNNSDSPHVVLCSVYIAPAATPSNAVFGEIRSPSAGSEERFTATVDDGSYQIEWYCRELTGDPNDPEESWGTGNEGKYTKTADLIFFTAPVIPDDDSAGSLGDLDPGVLVGVLGALAAGSLALGSS
ncbi:hypothetical protein EF834_01930 [Rhodococcus spongiicola]|uniref:Uncharacterized protein n=1 Tax=Rhodococcus spongiicola TaxID=2487352 RepID=A0A3S3ZQX2_9NOCA|nr:hypothetical protein EF834_01930 [Rhodococcus spongiicola]